MGMQFWSSEKVVYDVVLCSINSALAECQS
jgi:hypothetical protein